MALTIKKVLNSSVVLVEDENQAESIALGKGIGYGAKRGETVSDSNIHQLFVPLQSEQQSQILALLEEIDPAVVDVTTEIIEMADASMQHALAPGLSFALMDHIAFALQRLKQGFNIQNKLYWEVQSYYPTEFAVGEKAVVLIDRALHVQLPKEEAANIAFHLINATQNDSPDYDSIKVTELVDDTVNIIRYRANQELSPASISYQRLITHVKFFADRLFTGKQLDDADDVMIGHLQTRYPQAAKISNQICQFIQRKYNLTVSDAEYTYLVVHVARNIK